jgi:predicted transcriptional regulator
MVVATNKEIKFANKVKKALEILGIDYETIQEALTENITALNNVNTQLAEAVKSAKEIEKNRNEINEELKNQFLEQETLK